MGFSNKNKVNSIIYIKHNNHRYFLKLIVNLKPSPKTVVVIMKNPSKTCDNMNNTGFGPKIISDHATKAKCHIDRTTGIVLRKLKAKPYNYDKIIVLNLYSLYDSKPANVEIYYYGNKRRTRSLLFWDNLSVSMFLKIYSGDVICAWGKPNGINKNGYDNQINYVNTLLNKRQHNLLEYDLKKQRIVARNTANAYPLHGLGWK